MESVASVFFSCAIMTSSIIYRVYMVEIILKKINNMDERQAKTRCFLYGFRIGKNRNKKGLSFFSRTILLFGVIKTE